MTIAPVTIAPGMTVTVDQFEKVAAALAEHAPEVAVSWDQWIDPSRWGLVPDEDTGRCYKAEFTLSDHPGLLRRVNVWFEPDLRVKGRPRPHSHPWPFTAHVLTGGYSEDRYVLDGGDVHQEQAEHRPDGVNDMPRDLFHEVTDLHTEPGGTLTLMVASAPGVRGGWGYLDPSTGRYDPAPPSSDAFWRAWRALNPHREAT